MVAYVEQHVRERRAHLPRCPQDTEMEAIREHSAAAMKDAIERPRESGADRHHATSQSGGIRGFDEQVGVGVLQAVVDEPEIAAVARASERMLDRTYQRRSPK